MSMPQNFSIKKPERQKKIPQEIRREFVLGAIRSARSDMFDSYFNDLNGIEKKIVVDRATAIQILQLTQFDFDRLLEKSAKKLKTKLLF